MGLSADRGNMEQTYRVLHAAQETEGGRTHETPAASFRLLKSRWSLTYSCFCVVANTLFCFFLNPRYITFICSFWDLKTNIEPVPGWYFYLPHYSMNLACITANICSFKTRKSYPSGEQVGLDSFCPGRHAYKHLAWAQGAYGSWRTSFKVRSLNTACIELHVSKDQLRNSPWFWGEGRTSCRIGVQQCAIGFPPM